MSPKPRHDKQNQNNSEQLPLFDRSSNKYDEYLSAMKRIHKRSLHKDKSLEEDLSPRERRRRQLETSKSTILNDSLNDIPVNEAMRISIIASMVPDEIIYSHTDYSIRSYETALMFIDVSGFTELCETYTKTGRGGPSRLTQVLNSYIGAMVQEILTHNGDVLKFSGDAFLSMWKKTPRLTMQHVVHSAIDCGIIIQKNYGTYLTDVGVVLKVKIAISAGLSHFSIIGDGNLAQSHYVIVGQPVWDVKLAEYLSTAGDVLTSASAWIYVNETEYYTQPCVDGRHTKVLGVGATWKRVEKLEPSFSIKDISPIVVPFPGDSFYQQHDQFREFSLRPAVVAAMQSPLWPSLRPFMVTPVLRAVDNDEPMDFLTEVRRVVVVFLNIITSSVTESVLIEIVNDAYKRVCSVSSQSGGLVNKVSMFDKDMMFLVVFGLRGLKHEDEAQKALLCAYELKQSLNNPNITSVSIGVTSGKTYCGVVGHVLRREYTVIGSAVNKAARIMMNYVDKLTCDKETFLRSKLEQEYFKLMEAKSLKGLAKPGPIYEFNKEGWSANRLNWRHPIIGREEELRKYKTAIDNAMIQQKQYTKYRDHKYALVFLGPKFVGKTRLIEECINITPNFIRVENILLKKEDSIPFRLIGLLFLHFMTRGSNLMSRENMEYSIRRNLDMSSLSPKQIFSLNVIFNCKFSLPENFEYEGDILNEYSIKVLVQNLCKLLFKSFSLVVVDNAEYIDDNSWRIILYFLETKTVFFLMGISDEENLSKCASEYLENGMIVKLHLLGIERCYHAALACQLLDVEAIPADLEKVIQSASGGLPGWIQNFVISLVQLGELSIVTVPRNKAIQSGAIVPSSALLQKWEISDFISIQASLVSDMSLSKSMQRSLSDDDPIQMAVLAESYNFSDMKLDMTLDAIILKTYDSLTPFEKMLLKCASVLGDVFSRQMLQHLLETESSRTVALAIEKLFKIRVLECKGGDFTRDISSVLVQPAPAHNGKPPYCACLGIRQPADCVDLPPFAFCGYMKFKHGSFRTTTYDLLTDSQKGLTQNNKVQQMHGSRETVFNGEQYQSLFSMDRDNDVQVNLPIRGQSSTNCKASAASSRRTRVRSFSSLKLSNCECINILNSVYGQIIEHCRGAGEYNKLYEAYLEFTDLSALSQNMPQANRLLLELEYLVQSDKFEDNLSKLKWVQNYRLARICSMRGACMLDSGDVQEARKQLFDAMELYNDPFPNSGYGLRIRNTKEWFNQTMTLYLVPQRYVATEMGFVGNFFEDVASTLNVLYNLFTENKEMEKAKLTAKWSLNYALKTDSNFRVLCISYGNMIAIYRMSREFSRCLKLEERAMELCHRKCGQIDVTEVHAVCSLYTSIFLFYIEYGKKIESLEFGVSVMPLITYLTDLQTRQMLLLSMLKLLLVDSRIDDMVLIMREYFYMADPYDLSARTWYYYFAMVIILDTGYWVETYASSEKFYEEKGDALLRSKIPESAWNYFTCMWLITIRLGAWEKSILWEEKIEKLIAMKFERHEFSVMILVRLVEGLLITLVREMDNRNLKKIVALEKILKIKFQDMENACKMVPMYRPRVLLLNAYFYYIKGKKYNALKYLNKASAFAKYVGHNILMQYVEHTRSHWKGKLNPSLLNYWTRNVENIESDNKRYYKDFDKNKIPLIPYTLPLPRDLEI